MKNKQTQWKNPGSRKVLLQKREEAKKKDAEGNAVEPKPDPEIVVEDIDVMSVQDVNDLGTGEPLYANFVFEDWALLSIRYELWLLVHAWGCSR